MVSLTVITVSLTINYKSFGYGNIFSSTYYKADNFAYEYLEKKSNRLNF